MEVLMLSHGPAARLLRHLALGLPLAAGALAGCTTTGGGCDGPRMHSFALDAAQTRQVTPGGTPDFAECALLCEQLAALGYGTMRTDGGLYSGPVLTCEVTGVGTATMTCTSRTFCIGGRRPSGLVERAAPAGTAVGGFLARAAHLEAASVPAFRELAAELALHGGPPALSAACARAARDEERHARTIGRLARAEGATPPPVVRDVVAPRALSDVLFDDVVEGCVHEAFAALAAAHQATAAGSAELRAAYRGIARDEARHALLSFAIADWAALRVPARDARRADDARRSATAVLAVAVGEGAMPVELGLPDATRAVELVRLLAA